MSKVGDKNSDGKNVNAPVGQHVPAQQLLSPTHSLPQHVQAKDDSKEKTLKVTNSTTITLIENGTLNGEKDKDYPKNYFTLEPKIDKKDEGNKNSITITKTVPKQSPGNQQDKSKNIKPVKRPLQYLETLAEKAGITFEDKYEAANTLLALDKQNSPSRRPPEIKQKGQEQENHNQTEDYRYRNQKEEDDKLQVSLTLLFVYWSIPMIPMKCVTSLIILCLTDSSTNNPATTTTAATAAATAAATVAATTTVAATATTGYTATSYTTAY